MRVKTAAAVDHGTGTIPVSTVATANRVVAIDALRGAVMLLLVPDVTGGFSFYKMAQAFPGSTFWAFLGEQFSHAHWRGAHIWDLIWPSFVLLVGVVMPMSVAARRARGESEAVIFGHMLLRAAALFLLPLMLRIPQNTHLDQLWPFVLIASGLPLGTLIARTFSVHSARLAHRVDIVWSIAIVLAAAARIGMHVDDLGQYGFVYALSQLALASVFASFLVGRRVQTQLVTIGAILLGYWLLFALYPPQPAVTNAADEVFRGFFGHWSKHANVGATLDGWFMNLLPREAPFLYDRNGLVTVDFVPTVATMIIGIMAGELIRNARPKREIRNILLLAGTALVIAGALADLWLCPLVKALMTPSWTLFSSGCVLLLLAGFYQVAEIGGRARPLLFPLVVLGSNSILLYTLAYSYRWWFVLLPQRVTGIDVFGGAYAPLLESLGVLAMLWAIAFVLYRFRIFVRL